MALLLPNERVARDQMQGYRIFVWSHDHEVPPHVHFGKGADFSTWDLVTLNCIYAGKFSSSDLRVQRKLLVEFHAEVQRSWRAHWEAQAGRRR